LLKSYFMYTVNSIETVNRFSNRASRVIRSIRRLASCWEWICLNLHSTTTTTTTTDQINSADDNDDQEKKDDDSGYSDFGYRCFSIRSFGYCSQLRRRSCNDFITATYTGKYGKTINALCHICEMYWDTTRNLSSCIYKSTCRLDKFIMLKEWNDEIIYRYTVTYHDVTIISDRNSQQKCFSSSAMFSVSYFHVQFTDILYRLQLSLINLNC